MFSKKLNFPKHFVSIFFTIFKNEVVFIGKSGYLIFFEISNDLKVIFEKNFLYFVSLKKSIVNANISLVYNLIMGSRYGHKKKIFLEGLGYKLNKYENNTLYLSVGYCQDARFSLPNDFPVKVHKKGKSFTIFNINLVKLGSLCERIRQIRVPDSYKGKGIYIDKITKKLKKGKQEFK